MELCIRKISLLVWQFGLEKFTSLLNGPIPVRLSYGQIWSDNSSFMAVFWPRLKRFLSIVESRLDNKSNSIGLLSKKLQNFGFGRQACIYYTDRTPRNLEYLNNFK